MGGGAEVSASFFIGLLFAVAGFGILLAQLGLWQAAQHCRATADDIKAAFGHDTKIFPDYLTP